MKNELLATLPANALPANALPANVGRVLASFIEEVRNAFDDDLSAIVLYGSGAEGKLRPTSDVNLLLLLKNFEQKKSDRLREPLRIAQAAIRLRPMYLLEAELQPAIEAFAVKFADIIRRHQVLYGDDPFTDIQVSRADSIVRLKQTLLNLTLRLREAYVARGLREEQLVATIADAAGPLRACAATLLELEGQAAASPKEALIKVASSLDGGSLPAKEIALLSEARENKKLEVGAASPTLFHLMELARSMWRRASALS